jgi:hypothetical protein
MDLEHFQGGAAGQVEPLILEIYIGKPQLPQLVRDETGSVEVKPEGSALDIKAERASFAHKDMLDPELQVWDVINLEVRQTELACVEGRASAECQKMVHKVPDRLHARFLAHDTKARGGLPEVTPAPGEHASPHRVLRRKEGQHEVEDVVSEGAEEVTSSSPGTGRHSGTGGGPSTLQGSQPPTLSLGKER